MRPSALSLVILAAAGCGGGHGSHPGDDAAVSLDGGADAAIDAPATTDVDAGPDGGSGACAGMLTDDCGSCLDGACCDAVTACSGSYNCVACLGGLAGAHGCSADPQVQAVAACAQTSCAGTCLTGERTRRASCNAPATAPSAGACVAMGGAVHCNPVTNQGCNTAAGETCDVSYDGFECYPSPGMLEVCDECGDSGGCGAGLTCLGGGGNVANRCARWCCDDGDCGGGRCDRTLVPQGNGQVGVCVGGTYVDDTLAQEPDQQCDSPPLTHDACVDCCRTAHPAGAATYDANAHACACGASCAAECAGWCAGGAVTADCTLCISHDLLDGTCTDTCTGDPECVAAMACTHEHCDRD